MPPLNKKQAKTAAYRAKGKHGNDKKSIKFEDLQALPQSDDEPETGKAPKATPISSEVTTSAGKRKRDDSDKESGAEARPSGPAVDEDCASAGGGKSSKRRKNKQAAKANKYILFVGSLSATVLPADLESHFAGFCQVKPTAVRLLTKPWDKEGLSKIPARQRAAVLARTEPPPPGVGGQSKGCAFVEFDHPTAAQEALLKGHGTFLKGKNIAVELTAGTYHFVNPMTRLLTGPILAANTGGGGTGTNRAEKIKTKNAKLKEERQKIHAKILESKAEGGKHTSFSEDGTASSAPAEKKSDPPQGKPGTPKRASGKGTKPPKPRRHPASTGANAVPVSREWGRSD